MTDPVTDPTRPTRPDPLRAALAQARAAPAPSFDRVVNPPAPTRTRAPRFGRPAVTVLGAATLAAVAVVVVAPPWISPFASPPQVSPAASPASYAVELPQFTAGLARPPGGGRLPTTAALLPTLDTGEDYGR